MTLKSLSLHSTAFAARVALVVVTGAFGSACSSAAPTDAPRNQGPNSTTGDPGPNSTVADPGPNPTNDAPETVSGELAIVDGNCVQLKLDGNGPLLMLEFRENYAVDARGLSRDGAVIAPPRSRLFVTGYRATSSGRCGIKFNVESLNSAQNP